MRRRPAIGSVLKKFPHMFATALVEAPTQKKARATRKARNLPEPAALSLPVQQGGWCGWAKVALAFFSSLQQHSK